MQARLAASEQALEAERTAHQTTREQLDAAKNAVKLTTLQIEKLKVQLARLRRMKFGQSSERLTLLADQLELTLENLEAEHTHAACVVAGDVSPDVPQAPGRKPRREPLPAHLPRQEVIHPAPEADGCTACGGTMSALGEDVTEVLEYARPADHHCRPLQLSLEDFVLDNTRRVGERASVFTGPVFRDDDPVYRGIAIPLAFWKVIAFIHDDGRPSASAYLIEQDVDLDRVSILFGPFKTYQRSVASIAEMTRLDFGDLPVRDGFSNEERETGQSIARTIRTASDILL